VTDLSALLDKEDRITNILSGLSDRLEKIGFRREATNRRPVFVRRTGQEFADAFVVVNLGKQRTFEDTSVQIARRKPGSTYKDVTVPMTAFLKPHRADESFDGFMASVGLAL
jgi:hypothetical protein